MALIAEVAPVTSKSKVSSLVVGKQTQLQPPSPKKAYERLVIQVMHLPVTHKDIGTAPDWGIVGKFDAIWQTGVECIL
jgi:hypothetical protein